MLNQTLNEGGINWHKHVIWKSIESQVLDLFSAWAREPYNTPAPLQPSAQCTAFMQPGGRKACEQHHRNKRKILIYFWYLFSQSHVLQPISWKPTRCSWQSIHTYRSAAATSPDRSTRCWLRARTVVALRPLRLS